MADEISGQHVRQMMEFLRVKMRSVPDTASEVIVRRHEVDAYARSVGMDEEEAWQIFTGLKGFAWEGQYMAESRSEERGYTAARLMWVRPGPP
jgi:hypothetical protein